MGKLKLMSQSITESLSDSTMKYIDNLKLHKEANGQKDIDVNQIFKNKYTQKNRNRWIEAREKFAKFTKKPSQWMKAGTEIISVNINDIWPGQIGISKEGLIEKLENGYTITPQAIKVNVDGEMRIILIDGHHSIASDIINGKTKVDVLVKSDNFTHLP